MLAKVLSAGEDEAGIEVAPVGDDVMRTKAALAQRTTGNLAALSGAHGLTYMEVQSETFTSQRSCVLCLPATCIQGLANCLSTAVAKVPNALGTRVVACWASNAYCGFRPGCALPSNS